MAIKNSTGRASSATAADIDGDGDIDVVASFEKGNRIVWFQNLDGQGNFSTGVNVSTDSEGAYMVITADVDGDGDQDIVAANYVFNGGTVMLFKNVDGLGVSWSAVELSSDTEGPVYVQAADLDSDGDLDVVSASYGDGQVVWYENDRNEEYLTGEI